jgi:tripartite-type tricarboxylate transporter receptor subunit TctC
MSALGQKQKLHRSNAMSALPPKADIAQRGGNVRYVPEADILAAVRYDGWPSSRGIVMKLPRRKFLNLAMGATALSALSDTALALDYPTRPVHWIIGFPPGGGADIVARILGAWLAERIGQQVIVENRPGAGTNIATEYVVHSAPDGYTLLWAGVSNAINASIFSDLSFDFLKDIAPVSGVVAYPLVIEVNPQVPAMNIAELIALAKASPGKLTLASYGTGTISSSME